MRPRESVLSIFAAFCLSFLLFVLAGTSPMASVVYADTSAGENLPADTCADTTCTSVGCTESEEETIIDIFIDFVDAVL